MTPTLDMYPPHLRGPSNNRFGGHQATRLRTYGGKFGPANEGRRLSRKECEIIAKDLKKRGVM